MIHFVFSDNAPQYLFLKYDTELEYTILHEKLKAYLNLVDPICYLPTYKGSVYTNDFLFEYRQPTGTIIFYASIGLWHTIWKWFNKQGIEYDGLDPKWFKRNIPHSFDEFKTIVDSWGLTRTPRPYQYETAYKILTWKRSVSQLATRAGKTLIAYMVFRYCWEYLKAKKILMIVPSIELVKQGYSDFSEYAEFFKTECLWGGGKIVESSNLTIATFQTLVSFLDRKSKKYNPSFFNDYDIVFVDETHRATAASIKNIITQPFMKNVKIAFGMTGTLPQEDTSDRFCVHALLGAKIVEISPKWLMDNGYISKIKITQHNIEYSDKEKQLDTWIKCAEYCLSSFDEEPDPKHPGKMKRIKLAKPEFLIACKKTFPAQLAQAREKIYTQSGKSVIDKKLEYRKLLQAVIKCDNGANLHHIEQMMVHFFPERVKYLCSILDNCQRNTLVLAQHVEYIKYVADEVRKAFPDRHVLCVYGGSKERNIIKDTLATHDNCIIIGNYAIMSTGITLPGLCHGVLFESFKSNVVNTQSAGRGLALIEGKEYYDLHDITDCFDSKYASNKIFLQGRERRKQFDANQYDYKIIRKEL